jgi:uncharacterized protein (TIGR02246 family)
MRHPIIFSILAAALLFHFGQPGVTHAGQGGQAEVEVRKLERAWLDAYEQHDASAMNAIVADDFTITFPDGSIQDKQQILDSIKQPRTPSSLAFKFHTEDVKARVYGETVILMGRVISEYQRDGKAVKEQSRYTDTYVRRDGRWQVVASHLSNVAPARPQKSHASDGTGRK